MKLHQGRRPPQRPRPFVEGQPEPLHHELELAFLFGRGSRGLPVELRDLEGWRRLWNEYRDIVEPKAREYLPGRRPVARYLLGELQEPPRLREPPLDNSYARVWIAGLGRYWTDYPEPFQRDELAWLVRIGECDADEYRRAVELRRSPDGPNRFGSVWQMLGKYPLEAGIYL